jgi:hypothetical protein
LNDDNFSDLKNSTDQCKFISNLCTWRSKTTSMQIKMMRWVVFMQCVAKCYINMLITVKDVITLTTLSVSTIIFQFDFIYLNLNHDRVFVSRYFFEFFINIFDEILMIRWIIFSIMMIFLNLDLFNFCANANFIFDRWINNLWVN